MQLYEMGIIIISIWKKGEMDKKRLNKLSIDTQPEVVELRLKPRPSISDF